MEAKHILGVLYCSQWSGCSQEFDGLLFGLTAPVIPCFQKSGSVLGFGENTSAEAESTKSASSKKPNFVFFFLCLGSLKSWTFQHRAKQLTA